MRDVFLESGGNRPKGYKDPPQPGTLKLLADEPDMAQVSPQPCGRSQGHAGETRYGSTAAAVYSSLLQYFSIVVQLRPGCVPV